MRLRVRYSNGRDLLAAYRAQMVRGTLLVRGDIPEGVNLGDDVELEIELERVGAATVRGRVAKLFPGSGVGVRFDTNEALFTLLTRAREAPVAAGPPSQGMSAPPKSKRKPAAAVAPPRDARTRIREASPAELVKIALHGTREERTLLMRGSDARLQSFVLTNPGLPPEEVAVYAAMETLRAAHLEEIAARSEWAEDPRVAAALVRNPRTPLPLAMALLCHVSPTELRRIAKDARTRTAVQHAAKKRLLG
ncbi:MAG: hypothetical protein HYV09_16555 [Deltaproteobacteria bacterium]|nr:hypothetical protein [Deltaproteobacteria bacterium]